MREGWRRRPDLNRGWRFCRQGRDVYLVDSSCFLVGPTPSFFPVFGRNCSQVVPKFLTVAALSQRRVLERVRVQYACFPTLRTRAATPRRQVRLGGIEWQ